MSLSSFLPPSLSLFLVICVRGSTFRKVGERATNLPTLISLEYINHWLVLILKNRTQRSILPRPQPTMPPHAYEGDVRLF